MPRRALYLECCHAPTYYQGFVKPDATLPFLARMLRPMGFVTAPGKVASNLPKAVIDNARAGVIQPKCSKHWWRNKIENLHMYYQLKLNQHGYHRLTSVLVLFRFSRGSLHGEKKCTRYQHPDC